MLQACQKKAWKSHRAACHAQRELTIYAEAELNEANGKDRVFKRADRAIDVWMAENLDRYCCLSAFAFCIQNGMLTPDAQPCKAYFKILQREDLRCVFRDPDAELQQYLYVEVTALRDFEHVYDNWDDDSAQRERSVMKTLIDRLHRVDINEGVCVCVCVYRTLHSRWSAAVINSHTPASSSTKVSAQNSFPPQVW